MSFEILILQFTTLSSYCDYQVFHPFLFLHKKSFFLKNLIVICNNIVIEYFNFLIFKAQKLTESKIKAEKEQNENENNNNNNKNNTNLVDHLSQFERMKFFGNINVDITKVTGKIRNYIIMNMKNDFW
jgi:hypothetical protein